MLGLKRGTVELASFHQEWARLFEKEKSLLLKTFGDRILAIEHIGSTAISGVPTKPLIDINAAVSLLDDAYIEEFVAPLEKLGYEYKRSEQYDHRRLFVKGPEAKRTHHLNLVKIDSAHGWKDALVFRNYLQRHKSAREEYAALKENLAGQYSGDRASYTKGKQDFIKKIIQLATA